MGKTLISLISSLLSSSPCVLLVVRIGGATLFWVRERYGQKEAREKETTSLLLFTRLP
jgi:hypothetical protein